MDPSKQQYPPGGGYPPQPGYPPQTGYPNVGFPGQQGYPNPGYPGQQGYPYPGGSQPQPMGFTMPIRPDIPLEPKPEGLEHGEFDFTDKTIRRGFIRKVYSILMVQLLVSVGFIALFLFHAGVKQWTRQNSWFYLVALAFFFVTALAMSCCPSVRRKSPGNFICLSIFTLAASVCLGAVASTHSEETVLIAAGITTVICFALTLFAFQTKFDFTRLNGILLVCLLVLVIFGFLMIFIRLPVLRLIYSCLGALLFSVYLIHDTQLLMGGDHKYSISPEEYIFAALTLYLDIFNIFMYILSIVGGGGNR